MPDPLPCRSTFEVEVERLTKEVAAFRDSVSRTEGKLAKLKNQVSSHAHMLERARAGQRSMAQHAAEGLVVSLSEYATLRRREQDIRVWLSEFRKALAEAEKELKPHRRTLSTMEQALADAQKRLGTWGKVIPLRRP